MPEDLGWTPVDAFHEILGPQGTLGRDSQRDVVLTHRLRFAIRKLNAADVPITEAVELIAKDRSIMDRVRADREVYHVLRDGYRDEWTDEQGNSASSRWCSPQIVRKKSSRDRCSPTTSTDRENSFPQVRPCFPV